MKVKSLPAVVCSEYIALLVMVCLSFVNITRQYLQLGVDELATTRNA
jgi:hypothetical protein